MQRIETTTLESGWADFAKYVISPVVGALVGFLVAAVSKVSKSEAHEYRAALEKQLEKINERQSRFEAALSDKVSRAELKEAVGEVRHQLDTLRAELRGDFAQLRDLILKRD